MSGAASQLLVCPMRLRPADLFTDDAGEWEVVSRPSMRRNDKIVWAKVRRPHDDASLTTRSWGAHELITVMRRIDLD